MGASTILQSRGGTRIDREDVLAPVLARAPAPRSGFDDRAVIKPSTRISNPQGLGGQHFFFWLRPRDWIGGLQGNSDWVDFAFFFFFFFCAAGEAHFLVQTLQKERRPLGVWTKKNFEP